MLTDAEVDRLLSRWDQTEPAMQRRIVARLAGMARGPHAPPGPAPDALTPAQLAAYFSEAVPAARRARLASALERIIAEVGRLALAGLLRLPEGATDA